MRSANVIDIADMEHILARYPEQSELDTFLCAGLYSFDEMTGTQGIDGYRCCGSQPMQVDFYVTNYRLKDGIQISRLEILI